MKLATMLDEAHGKLNDINHDDLNQNEAFISKFNSLKALYINLVTRLQKLQQPCDHTAQVDTLKFEQDVGLQTEDPSIQDLGTQTEIETWTRTWIYQVSMQLDSIQTHMISDSQNLLSLLEVISSLNEE